MTNDSQPDFDAHESDDQDNTDPLDRPISDFTDDELNSLLHKHYPNLMAEIAETARKAYAPIDAEFLKSISRANIPRIDYTSAFRDMVPKIDLSAYAPKIELPPISDELQKTLDQAYKGISESVAVLPGVEAVLQSARELSEQYAGLLPFARREPLPYLQSFNDEFLAVYACLVLAAARVENLMADLCQHHFGEGELRGATHRAQKMAKGLRKALANEAPCATCRGIAEDLEEPIDMRNTFVHGSWEAGADIASEEEKARQALVGRALGDSRVRKRKLLDRDQIETLASGWKDGDENALDDLFEEQIISLGIVTAYAEIFTEFGDALEDELIFHEQEQ
ncbi:hypothetical protein [Corynebacterium mucifaciens]|uniref:Uncharacterized protein n=1 Tax=Corynebacterium mucifaciens TaxID=57171 RepID=A0A7X6LSA3_9CORY|nr:hypothetical protein [Corynebacterium mucifaciens]NKY69448.1 hypothetical protein [Corynebacterium mucifaciens]